MYHDDDEKVNGNFPPLTRSETSCITFLLSIEFDSGKILHALVEAHSGVLAVARFCNEYSRLKNLKSVSICEPIHIKM